FEHLTALRSGWHLQIGSAFECRHCYFAAERRERECDRHFAVEVVFFALKNFVLLNVNDDVKIARRTTTDAGFAIAHRAQARVVRDSRRDFQLDPTRFFHATFTAAFPTRFFDDLSDSVTARTGLRDMKKTARRHHLAAT